MTDDNQNETMPTPQPLPGQVFIRPGIDDRPDYEKTLTPEAKAALKRLAVQQRPRVPEASNERPEVQAARLADQVLAGAQVQVIGVGQHDFRADFQHLARGHGLDGGCGAHGHVDGGMDVAVRRMKQAQPRAGLLAGFEHLKGKLAHRSAPFRWSLIKPLIVAA